MLDQNDSKVVKVQRVEKTESYEHPNVPDSNDDLETPYVDATESEIPCPEYPLNVPAPKSQTTVIESLDNVPAPGCRTKVHPEDQPDRKDSFDLSGEEDNGLFSSVGISHETAEALAECRLPKKRVCNKMLDGTKHEIPVPIQWKTLPIVQQKDYRAYGGEYATLFRECLKPINPYCCFTVKANYVKKVDSRKKSSPFYKGTGRCSVPSCGVAVEVLLNSDLDDFLLVKFKGNVKHDITKPKSFQIRGKEREKEKNKYRDNIKTNPNDRYIKLLKSVPPESFAYGNRDGAGTLKTHQNIKAEVMREMNSFEFLHKRLLDLQKDLIDKDSKKALESGASFRKIFGFLQSFSSTNSELRIILYHEKEIRLFHDLCKKDIVYLDATGNIITEIKPYKTVYMYAIGLRHPFGDTFPLPTGMYITNDHGAESVRYFLMKLREAEKLLYGGNAAQPKIIISDNSKVLQNACLMEFNGETRLMYNNRTHRIVTGVASARDLSLTILVSCHTHIIGQAKRNLKSYDGSKKHFCLRVIGRMIDCYDLDELSAMVRHFQSVVTSKYIDKNMTEALDSLSKMINEWLPGNDDDDDDESEKIEEDEEDDYWNKSHWYKYWEKVLGPVSKNAPKKDADSESPPQIEDDRKVNKYFAPQFFSYFRKEMLKDAPLWTNLILADYSAHGPQYSKFLKEPRTKGRNFRVKNASNAPVENVFKFLKCDKSHTKIPLVQLVPFLDEKLGELCTEFVDNILRKIEDDGIKSDFSKTVLEKMKELNLQTKWKDDGNGDFSPDKEYWGCKPQDLGKSKRSKYIDPPKNKITFNASLKNKMSKNQDQKNFKTFKEKRWGKEAKRHSKFEEVDKSLKSEWAAMSVSEKMDVANEFGCCGNDEKDEQSMECTLCKKKFHPECVQYNSMLGITADKFSCVSCVQANFKSLVNYLSYHLRNAYTDEIISDAIAKFTKLKMQTTCALGEHRFLNSSSNLFVQGEVISKIGISNPFNNCWLSVLCHSLFGTSIKSVISAHIHDENTMQLIEHISSFISSSSISAEIFPSLMKLSQLCNNNELRQRKYCDPGEALEHLVTSLKIDYLFSANLVSISRCEECDQIHGGTKSVGVTVEVKLPGYLESCPIENLIWNTYTARHLDPFDGGEWCPYCQKIVGANVFTFFTNCPMVLALKIDRNDLDSRCSLNTGGVELSNNLDISNLCPSFVESDVTQYTLIATVNSGLSSSTNSNHFVSYLFNQVTDSVVCFDDNEVMTEDNMVGLADFKTSAYIAFYIRNDLFKRPTVVSSKFDLSYASRLQIDRAIFDEPDREYFRILHSVIGNTLLTGDAISLFLLKQAEASVLKVLVGTSNLLSSVKNGHQDQEYSHFIETNFSALDVIVIPFHHQLTKGGHWTLIVIYPICKAIIHLDSLNLSCDEAFHTTLHLVQRNHSVHETSEFSAPSWKLIKPSITQQNDSVNCGVWCCINSYKVLFEEEFECQTKDLPFARYWIAQEVMRYKSKKLFNKNARREASHPVRGKIVVEVEIPGKRDGTIFQQMFSFRASTEFQQSFPCRSRNIDVPSRACAQGSRAKLSLLIENNQVEMGEMKTKKRRHHHHQPSAPIPDQSTTAHDDENGMDDDGGDSTENAHSSNDDREDDEKEDLENDNDLKSLIVRIPLSSGIKVNKVKNESPERDSYSCMLSHHQRCRVNAESLVKFRQLDRNIEKDSVKYMNKMKKFIKDNNCVPSESSCKVHLVIDRYSNRAVLWDGNHRISCIAAMKLNRLYIPVQFSRMNLENTIGYDGDLKEVPKSPSVWPSFPCGCHFGLDTAEIRDYDF